MTKTMTHKDLQAILKEYRAIGYDLQVKLNATTQLLQAELDRLQNSHELCELTSAVRLPLVQPEIETPRNIPAEFVQEIKAVDTYWTSWNAAYSQAIDSLNVPKEYHHDVFPSKLSQMTHEYIGVIAVTVLVILAKISYQTVATIIQSQTCQSAISSFGDMLKYVVKKRSNKKVYGFAS
jgi:hypothetical protein